MSLSVGVARLSDAEHATVVEGSRWIGALSPADLEIVRRAQGPVLDVGCGPGRHVLALAHDGKIALGIDLTRTAVDLARTRGAVVLHRSVFARVPGAGRWRTALLLDGNIGIGGNPVTLLQRLADLITPNGEILVELDAPGVSLASGTVRLELGSRSGPWFEWSTVSVDDLPDVSAAAGTTVTDLWQRRDRWFASLARGAGPGRGPGPGPE